MAETVLGGTQGGATQGELCRRLLAGIAPRVCCISFHRRRFVSFGSSRWPAPPTEQSRLSLASRSLALLLVIFAALNVGFQKHAFICVIFANVRLALALYIFVRGFRYVTPVLPVAPPSVPPPLLCIYTPYIILRRHSAFGRVAATMVVPGEGGSW